MTDLFTLDDNNNPIPCPEEDLLDWGTWMKTAKENGRTLVAETTVGDYHIHTHFCGCDHNWEDGPPVLFETLVTQNNERRDLHTKRYTTWKDAQAGHEQICEELKKNNKQNSTPKGSHNNSRGL